MRQRLQQNFIRTIPVLTGYIVLGMGFGILLASKGFGVVWSLLMSVFIFAGSMQYVACDLIAVGAGLITVALTTFMVNARHLFYGLSMIDRYKKTGKYRPYLIFGLTDETYSLLCENENLDSLDMFLITLMDQCWWIIGSVIGSILGSVIPWDFKGVDFSLTALFVCIVVDQWTKTKDHVPALIGIVASVICLVIFGPSDFLIPTMIVITLALTILKFIRKEDPVNV